VKVTDVVLVPNLQTQGSVFGHPQIHASTDVESILGIGAITVVRAVAPHNIRLDLLLVEKVVGAIQGHHPDAVISVKTPIGGGIHPHGKFSCPNSIWHLGIQPRPGFYTDRCV
jgi:hypothetical protein